MFGERLSSVSLRRAPLNKTPDSRSFGESCATSDSRVTVWPKISRTRAPSVSIAGGSRPKPVGMLLSSAGGCPVKEAVTAGPAEKSRSRRPAWAVLGTRRPVQRPSWPSWAPGGPSRGRLGHQEARPEVVLGARRLVQRPSWAPGGSSRGRLRRQKARPEAIWGARRPQNVGLTDSSSENAGLA